MAIDIEFNHVSAGKGSPHTKAQQAGGASFLVLFQCVTRRIFRFDKDFGGPKHCRWDKRVGEAAANKDCSPATPNPLA